MHFQLLDERCLFLVLDVPDLQARSCDRSPRSHHPPDRPRSWYAPRSAWHRWHRSVLLHRSRSPRANSSVQLPSGPAPCCPAPRSHTHRPHWPSAKRTASARSTFSVRWISSIKCTRTSVSVSLWKMCPRWTQLFLDGRIVLDDPVVDQRQITAGARCGCAFTSLGGPCVAQRVWPIPMLPLSGLADHMCDSRSLTLPWHLWTVRTSPFMRATPALSYPRYSNRRKSVDQDGIGLLVTQVCYYATHVRSVCGKGKLQAHGCLRMFRPAENGPVGAHTAATRNKHYPIVRNTSRWRWL